MKTMVTNELGAYAVLTPAYGRDYRSKEEVLAGWEQGDDFQIHTPTNTTYTSQRDVDRLKQTYTGLEFRYGKGMKLFVLSWR